MHNQTIRRFIAGTALTALFLCLTTAITLATPADEITRAVIAAGASSVEMATPVQFTTGYRSVIVRVKEEKRCPYVIAAIKLRPDLAPQITVATLRAHQLETKDSCEWVDPLIRCAIAAAPNAKEAIVRAALEAEPYSRECILAAAGMGDNQHAFFRPPGVDAGNINSTAIGTINPGNLGQGNVVTPIVP